MKGMADNSVDSVVTDPPYGIGFMGKEWDNFKPSHVKEKGGKERNRIITHPRTDGRKVSRNSSSVVAGSYDLSLAANHKFQDWYFEIAKEVLRVLKPGGHLLS